MTIQSLDRINYEGEELAFCGPPMPECDRRVPRSEFPVPLLTSMHRGYEAKWALRNSRLFLDSVWGEWTLPGGKPVFADWVTQEVELPMGPVIGQDIWRAVHERSLFLNIVAGMLCGTREIRNEPPPPQWDMVAEE